MSYIGNSPSQTAFLTDQFSGTGSQTAFTMSVAPANTASCIVAVSGVLQDPSTYAVVGTTLNFTVAPPAGSGNISVRYLGIPASGVTTTAYRTATEFTATSGQTTFTPPSYTVGYLDVYRNGVLLGSADYTATNGTTVVLATGCVAGDLVETISFYVSSVLNAIPNTAGSISSSNLPAGLTINTPTISSPTITTPSISSPTITTAATLPAATTIGGINYTPYTMKNRIINGSYDVWQRGTSTTVATGTGNNAFLADRWMIENTSGSTVTATRVANSSNTYGIGNYYINLAIPTFASGGHVDQFQSIESLNIADLAGQTVTLSYYAAVSGGSGATLQLQIWIGFPSTTDNYASATYSNPDSKTITSTPTRYTSTFTVPSGATTGLRVYVRMNNNGSSTSNATTFTLGGIQLEQGSYATAFEWLPYSMELALCQRYYLRLTGGGTNYGMGIVGMWIPGNNCSTEVMFPVAMRAGPTAGYSSIYVKTAGTSYNVTSIGGVYGSGGSGYVSGGTIDLGAASSPTAGYAGIVLANSSSSYIDFSAEI